MADRDRLRLDGEAGHRAVTPLGQHVVQQHGVDAPEHQIAVRMHVIVVRDRAQAVVALGAQQDVVRDRAAERGDAFPTQVGERPQASGIPGSHGSGTSRNS